MHHIISMLDRWELPRIPGRGCGEARLAHRRSRSRHFPIISDHRLTRSGRKHHHHTLSSVHRAPVAVPGDAHRPISSTRLHAVQVSRHASLATARESCPALFSRLSPSPAGPGFRCGVNVGVQNGAAPRSHGRKAPPSPVGAWLLPGRQLP